MKRKMEKYVLRCLECGKEYEEFRIKCDKGCNSLLRAEYKKREFSPTQERNIFKFMDWLPCKTKVDSTIGPIVYKSERFGKRIGLRNLYCAFNGYWPEMGAKNMTGTFKDYEALPTLMNFVDNGKKKIILSSVGNTARAFAYATTLLDFDTYIVIPDKMLERMWVPSKRSIGRIHIVAVRQSCDYYKAIRLGDKISKDYDIDTEGGAKNIARRDGMGTVMLEAARVLGHLPDHYFQAVGSGTGGIAAYEASLRLLQDERFKGEKIPRLNLAQNAPFTPIYKAWKEKIDIRPDEDVEGQIENVKKMHADVLANRNPAYYIRGGVADVLKESNGIVYEVNNEEAIAASQEFENEEGIDLVPAASVCVAALKQAVKNRLVDNDEVILINITGGGIKNIKRDYEYQSLQPEVYIDESNLDLIKEIL